jgi:short-subunit dehydrogenase
MALPDPSSDTTVLVTGASSGIGEALARELARRGHHLTLTARRASRLEDLAGELTAHHGVDVTVLPADLSRERSRSTLLRKVRGGDRAVVGLCNVAGNGAIGKVFEHDLAEEQLVFDVNAAALFQLTNVLVRDMVERGSGAVLNTGSILAFAPIPQNATYAATKAFVASFSEALHEELSGTGVSCTTLSPGPTRTPIFDRSGAEGAAGLGPGVFWQDAEDVAKPAVDGMVAGKRTVVPGLTNKLAVLGLSLTPRTALLPVTNLAQGESVRRFLLGSDGDGGDE